MASTLPPSRAFTRAVSSANSMMVSLSTHGLPPQYSVERSERELLARQKLVSMKGPVPIGWPALGIASKPPRHDWLPGRRAPPARSRSAGSRSNSTVQASTFFVPPGFRPPRMAAPVWVLGVDDALERVHHVVGGDRLAVVPGEVGLQAARSRPSRRRWA